MRERERIQTTFDFLLDEAHTKKEKRKRKNTRKKRKIKKKKKTLKEKPIYCSTYLAFYFFKTNDRNLY